MIKIQHLTRHFGNIKAVDDVSFELKKGEILGFIGPNGAGKSTTMRMLTGYLTPTEGTILIDGVDISDDEAACKEKIGYLPESAPMYKEMSVYNFLDFCADIRGFKGNLKTEKIKDIIKKCFLENVADQEISTLSKGYKQRTCFAQSIIHDPEILIMDEPTDGLDPNQKHEIRKIITEFGKEKAIILSTHILEEIEELCSRIVLINKGKIIFNGSIDEFKKDSEGNPIKLNAQFRHLTISEDIS